MARFRQNRIIAPRTSDWSCCRFALLTRYVIATDIGASMLFWLPPDKGQNRVRLGRELESDQSRSTPDFIQEIPSRPFLRALA